MGRYDTFNVLVPKRDKKQVRQHSHYDDKIDYTPGRPAGKTRDWGDASVPVQDAVEISSIVLVSCQACNVSLSTSRSPFGLKGRLVMVLCIL